MITFALDKQSPVPFYRQIVDMAIAGISGGAIAPGDKLPTIRELAVQLEVNPNTIVKAYSQLQMMGFLDTQQGTGAFVRAPLPSAASPQENRRALESLCRDFVSRAHLLNISIAQLVDFLTEMRETYAADAKVASEDASKGAGHAVD